MAIHCKQDTVLQQVGKHTGGQYTHEESDCIFLSRSAETVPLQSI